MYIISVPMSWDSNRVHIWAYLKDKGNIQSTPGVAFR